MRIVAYTPNYLPESFRVCVDALIPELRSLGCDVTTFDDPNMSLGDADVIWDPRAGGGNPPIAHLCGRAQPLVVTLHGVAPMAIPLREYYASWRERLDGFFTNRRNKRAWEFAFGRFAAVVTVSHFSKESIRAALPIPPKLIFTCHNAVDHKLFTPAPVNECAYFLHISNDEPRKNVDRICQAYLGLCKETRPPLYLKLPRHSTRLSGDGIKVIKERFSPSAIANLYRNALGFLFPSLYEGFGLPILEAMACGCPVITANDNACAEIAKNSAITVDARSVDAIRSAMQRLIADPEHRLHMIDAGLERASHFTWKASAHCYLEAFNFARRSW